MLLLRRFEAGRVYTEGKIGGFCHLYIGQEAVAVGVRPSQPDDVWRDVYASEDDPAMLRDA